MSGDLLKLTGRNIENLKKIQADAEALKGATDSSVKDFGTVNNIFNSGSSSSSVETTNLSATLAGMSVEEFEQLSEASKAEYNLIASLMDSDGDEKISSEEYDALVGLDGNKEFAQADIDSLYEQLGITSEEGLDALLTDIDTLLNPETEEVAAVYTPDEKINSTTSGVKFDEETGTYSVEVETFRGGKVQDDGQGGLRYPNGSLWGIVTNAYPDLAEADKTKVYAYMQEMNEGVQDVNILHTGDVLQLPVLTYDENGNVTGYEKGVAPTEAEKEPDKTEEVDTTESGTAVGSTTPETSTGSIAPASQTDATISSAGTVRETAQADQKDYAEITEWIDNVVNSDFANVDTLDKLLEKVETGGYDLKELISKYDSNHTPGLMESFDTRDLFSENGKEVANRFANNLIESFGGAESEDLQKYIDNLCNDESMGGFYLDGAPILAQQVYFLASDQIIASTEKDPTGETSLEGFYLNGSNSYVGLAGWNEAKADYEANVAIMKEFQELYEKYGDDKVAGEKVTYETYGLSDGCWDPFNKNYEGKNKISDIYEKMMSDGMGAGSSDWTNFHISMYKEAVAKLKEYDNLMG